LFQKFQKKLPKFLQLCKKGLGASLRAIIAAKNASDSELEKLLTEFLRITVFPPSHYRLYKNDAEGKKFDDEISDKEPTSKKPKKDLDEKIGEIKLWAQIEQYRSPENALVL